MSSQTTNYGLIKPGMNDSAIITSENTNMDSIDTILARIENDINALETLKAALIGDAQTKADAVSALIDGQALEPASIEATGAITANSIADANGTLAALRESVTQKVDMDIGMNGSLYQGDGGSTVAAIVFNSVRGDLTGHRLSLSITTSGLLLWDYTTNNAVWFIHQS